MRRFVCSDIHGQYELFLKMLDGIQFTEQDHLYILGDMIDRGPQSMELMQDIMKRHNVFCILGNHELMMLDYLYKDSNGNCWMFPGNGGSVTYQKYLELEKEEQDEMKRFIENMYLQIEIVSGDKTFLLSHSSFKDGGTLKVSEVYHIELFNIVWCSPWRFAEYEPEEYYDDGRIHVIGHVPVQRFSFKNEAYVSKNIVNIDLGCARLAHDSPGFLCCMDLDAFADGREAFRYFGYSEIDSNIKQKNH